MSILVLGGAGYIGSHAVDQLINKGYEVIVVDNLLTGHKAAVHPDARFYEGDIRDKTFLKSVFEKETIEGVLHFAASSLVGVSKISYSLRLLQPMASRKNSRLQKVPQRILKILMVKAN